MNPLVKANYLASPPLVVAYALAGSVDIDIQADSLGNDREGNPVYLKDIWPTPEEVQAAIRSRGGRPQLQSVNGSVAGLPAGPLASALAAAIADRF